MAESNARADGTNGTRSAHKGNTVSSHAPAKPNPIRLGEVSQIAATRLADPGNLATRKSADGPDSAARQLSSTRPQPHEFGSRAADRRRKSPARTRGSGLAIICVTLLSVSLIALVRMEGLPHLAFWDRQAATSQFALASDSVKQGLAKGSESPSPRLLVQDAHGTIGESANSAPPLQPSTAETPQVVTVDPAVAVQVAAVPPPTSQAIPEPVLASSPLGSEAIAMLVEQGKRLIASGDVAAARVVLRRAAESNDAAAALMLGSAYDPVVLRQLNVRGLGADIATARSWYRRANDLGSPEASRRLEMLASAEKG
jgi:TPR repeat protein